MQGLFDFQRDLRIIFQGQSFRQDLYRKWTCQLPQCPGASTTDQRFPVSQPQAK